MVTETRCPYCRQMVPATPGGTSARDREVGLSCLRLGSHASVKSGNICHGSGGFVTVKANANANGS